MRRGYILRRLFVLADLVALGCAGILTTAVASAAGRTISDADLVVFFAMMPLWVPIGIAFGTYHAHIAGRSLATAMGDEIGPVFRIATVWTWLVLLMRAAVLTGVVQLLPSIVLWAVMIPAVLITRSLTRQIAATRGWYRQRSIVVGDAEDRARIVIRIERHPEWGIDVVRELGAVNGDNDRAARADALLDASRGLSAERVIFASTPERLDERTWLSRQLTEAGLQVDLVPGDAEIFGSSAALGQLEGVPIVSLLPAHSQRSARALKRFLDLAIGVPALIVATPVLAYCAIRIKLDSPGPVFFRQDRAGRAGRRFTFVKLRTMDADAEERLSEVADLSIHGTGLRSGAFKVENDPRATGVGQRLRRRSLDELPQLWNVVKGDMSLVGPRPLPLKEDAHIAGHYEVRREVRPGMTGSWQVLGRSDIPFRDMLKLDYSYVMNWSLIEDLRLLVKTVGVVIRARGAY